MPDAVVFFIVEFKPSLIVGPSVTLLDIVAFGNVEFKLFSIGELIFPPITLPDVVVLVRVEFEPSLLVEPIKTWLPPVTLPDAVVFFRVVFKRAMTACN